MPQDGCVSPLKRSVQLPVKTCVTSDSLHRCKRFLGPPDSAFQIVASASTVSRAIRIHPFRLIAFGPVLPCRYVVDHVSLINRILGKDPASHRGAGPLWCLGIATDKRVP